MNRRGALRQRITARCLSVACLLVSACAVAQSDSRTYRLAILSPGSSQSILSSTLPELAALGFVEGQNLILHMRAGVPVAELPTAAREIAAAPTDLIIAVGPDAIRAAAAASKTIPILMSFTNDPVEEGLVQSYRKPGGNITGQMLRSAEQTPKRLELLHEAVPHLRRFGLLLAETASSEVQSSEAIARAQALGLSVITARAPIDDYEGVVAGLKEKGVEAIVVASDARLARDAGRIAPILAAAGLPAICEWDYMARQGCLISFGPDNANLRRRSAHLAARLLRGGAPADMPIEGVDRFELVINLKTARLLGLTFPATFLARADEAIE
jgi:putative tryptophan/tyrosine transport system substrate-binding protein